MIITMLAHTDRNDTVSRELWTKVLMEKQYSVLRTTDNCIWEVETGKS